MELPQIEGHAVIELIRTGRTGPVYKGIQESLQREVAIKVMTPKLLPHSKVVQEFLEKTRFAATLAHHSVISIYNVNQQEDDLIYYTMEYMPAGSLEQRLEEEGDLSQIDAVELTLEVARALEFGLHHDAVHGNLKPSKILFMEDDEASKLAGLGMLLAVVAKDTGRNPTPFTAPEMIEAERQCDFRADIFSLGAILYQMLLGLECFDLSKGLWRLGSNMIKVIPPSDVDSDFLPEIDEIISKMTVFETEYRYDSYEELCVDLEKAVNQLSGDGSTLDDDENEELVETTVVQPPSLPPPAEKTVTPPPAPPPAPASASPRTRSTAATRRTAPTHRTAHADRKGARKKKSGLNSVMMGISALIVAIGLYFILGNSGQKQSAKPSSSTSSTTRPTAGSRPKKKPKKKKSPALSGPLSPDVRSVEDMDEVYSILMDFFADSGHILKANLRQRMKASFVERLKAAKAKSDEIAEDGDYFAALKPLAILYKERADTEGAKKYIGTLMHPLILKLDKAFEKAIAPAEEKMKAGDFGGAKAAYAALAKKYKLPRWSRRTEPPIKRIDEVLLWKSAVETDISAEIKKIEEHKSRVADAVANARALASDYKYKEAAKAIQESIEAEPDDEIRARMQFVAAEIHRQESLFQEVGKVLKANWKSLKLKMVYQRNIQGIIVGADGKGLFLKMQQIETRKKYTDIELEQLVAVFSRLPLGPEGLLDLAAFCYARNLEAEAEKAKSRLLKKADARLKTITEAYFMARQDFLDRGGPATVLNPRVALREARRKWVNALSDLTLGLKNKGLAQLKSLAADEAASTYARAAGSLLSIQLDFQLDLPALGKLDLPTLKASGETAQKPEAVQRLAQAETQIKSALSHYQEGRVDPTANFESIELATKEIQSALDVYVEILKAKPGLTRIQDRMAKAFMLQYALAQIERPEK